MKKSHFRIPFPYKKQAISWKIPDIIRRFTANNGIFLPIFKFYTYFSLKILRLFK